jgi:hypothetical protein
MGTNIWEELYRNLRILELSLVPKVGQPTDTQIECVEKKLGLPLPLGYRDFIKVFGPGEIASDFRIRAPGFRTMANGESAEAFNHMVDLGAFNEILKHAQITFTAMDGPYSSQARRLIYFADNSAGDLVGWDPEDVRECDRAEYGIYSVLREEGAARCVAETFEEFIMQVCLADGFARAFGFVPAGEPIDPQFMTFSPATRSCEYS